VRRGVASIGGISIDTVRGAGGDYAEGLLGGNAAYGAWGASLWLEPGEAEAVGLVGGDFPQDWLLALAAAGISTDGLEIVETLATAVWRTTYTDWEHRSDPGDQPETPGGCRTDPAAAEPTRATGEPGELEPRLRADDKVLARVGVAHCAPVQPSVLLHNLVRLRDHDLTVLVDPGEESLDWTGGVTAAVLADTDVFCPSLEDLDGQSRLDPLGTATRLCELGPDTVVIKLGAAGSLVYSGGHSVAIPAAPSDVVDPTGAGDSYCGAFAAALARFDDPFVAGVLASATASITVEHRGLIACLGPHRADVRDRARSIAARAGLPLPDLTDP
jgi:ribokinase